MKKIMTQELVAIFMVLTSYGGNDSQESTEDTIKAAQEEAMKNMTPEQKEAYEAAQKQAADAMKAAQ